MFNLTAVEEFIIFIITIIIIIETGSHFLVLYNNEFTM